MRLAGAVAMEAVLNELVSVEDLKVKSGPEEGGGQNRKGQFPTRADRDRTVPVSSFWGSRTTAPSSLCGILLLVGDLRRVPGPDGSCSFQGFGTSDLGLGS